MLRRDCVIGGALFALPKLGGCQCAFAQESQRGCYVSDPTLRAKLGNETSGWAFNLDRDPVFGGSGDKDFDQALAHTLSRLSDLFAVLPGFAFFNEDQGPNAFASPSQRLRRSDGSVVFGQQLLRKLMSASEHPAARVAAVCAHEFGHIVQYKRGIDRILVGADQRVKRLELHADYLAGYFAGTRRLARSDFPAAVFADAQFNAGDNMVSNPNHHGTAQERGAAVSAGYIAAFRDKKTFDDAISAGIDYVRSVPG